MPSQSLLRQSVHPFLSDCTRVVRLSSYQRIEGSEVHHYLCSCGVWVDTCASALTVNADAQPKGEDSR